MKTIKLFNKALVTTNIKTFIDVNALASKLGYIVHPDVCNSEVYEWLNSQVCDYNSTFYKKWNDVTSKSRFVLFMDQIKHYSSTYGTDFTGETYLPDGDITLPELKNYKVILPITKEEVISRCEGMLFSGIALKQETIEDILSILSDLNYNVNIDLVKNKEAKMFLYKSSGNVPTDATEMVRFLVYLCTDKTLLIKDGKTIFEIKNRPHFSLSPLVEKFGYEKLSSVFYRFKPLFLAFRNNESNKECVNKLRRLAIKNHIPQAKSFFETLLSDKKDISLLVKELNDITNFKKISLLQTINIRLKELEIRSFVIRNQKLFIKEEKNIVDKEYLSTLYSVIYSNLCNCLSSKATKISIPKSVNITLPNSEKSFIGNYPIGTSFDFSDSDNIFGIYWKEENGARDLDLSLIDIDGKKYGWDSAYKNDNNSIVFSGDMTSANPEATELFYASKSFKPSIAKVNLYDGESNSKFKFFIAKEKVDNMSRNYMVNPDNIVVNVDLEMDSQEKILGVITENKFVLCQFRSGRGAVSGNSVTNLYTDYALNTLDCYISLEKLLVDSGFEITDEKPEIDLNNLSKDVLIDLIG